jgi:Protein of unknown function (DUF3460)
MSGWVARIFDFLAGRSGYRQTYVSDPTRFIRDYLARHPEEVESQKAGRAIWWDKTAEERAPTPSMRHAPKAGGNEATFLPAGGNEYVWRPDDNADRK